MSLFMVGGEGSIEKGTKSWILLFIFLEVIPLRMFIFLVILKLRSDHYWNYTGNLHRVDLSVVKHVLYFFRSSNMSFLFSNRSSKTFKPKKNIPEGSHQHELMKHANATLGSGISINFFLDNRSWTDWLKQTVELMDKF